MKNDSTESIENKSVTPSKKFSFRFTKKKLATIAGAITVALLCNYCAEKTPNYEGSPQFHDGAFKNVNPRQVVSTAEDIRVLWNFTFNKPPHTEPEKSLPVMTLSTEQLLRSPDNSVFRLGHSSLILKMKDKYWLTDPVFSKRASPVQWLGPKRFQDTPITIEQLPEIEGVLISHDHYDHLDYNSIMQLKDKTRYFLAPLGVGDLLRSWGIPPEKIIQLDWWQGYTLDGIQFVSTPAQHFSGRGLFDSNKRLWTSWTIVSDNFRLFFGGDSGYFDGFSKIGEAYGPFDMTFLETGAYDEGWRDIHMLPEDTIKAFQDLKGKWLFPIHNATFDLAFHTWDAPFNNIVTLAHQQGISLSTPEIGEGVEFLKPSVEKQWWKMNSQGK
ncbi:MBL fold metallo-hydrolase [Citrobacter portucalensis]|uniref:MBL fold metallo-hydrolase n=1 Tax=Citrobacter portucalensis TaxID=1639133 RepID=UPI00226BA234|nr:MBL fold metallo-hydrolase [Citrobacter portucalensis]MCX8981217.1 MBL fold metallo-hydrolase [Citrobacter portucalensis]